MNGYHRVLAFDFDGTLAENGSVPPALRTGLERLCAQGYVLFAATSRLFGAAPLNSLLPWLSGIVWENGAVLHHTATDEVYLPFGHIDPRLVEALHEAGVPLTRGQAIVSTTLQHHKAVWQVLNECGGGAKVATHKGQLLISPPGTTMGAGLEKLLDVCDYSPRNLVS